MLVPRSNVIYLLFHFADAKKGAKLPATITAGEKNLKISGGGESYETGCKPVFEPLNGTFNINIGFDADQPFPASLLHS